MLTTMRANYEGAVLDHYRTQADQHGLQPSSTMSDGVTRAKEVEALLEVLRFLDSAMGRSLRILEVGCGNGYLLSLIRNEMPSALLAGRDYSPEMVALATSRAISNCQVKVGDVRTLDCKDQIFDVVISERCLINLLDPSDQEEAIRELHRVLDDDGYVLFLEAFTDGLANLNRARTQLGLDAHDAPFHNLWFDKVTMSAMIDGLFSMYEASEIEGSLPSANFLSSHYFMSRVVYPAITQAPVQYNTDFVQFFQFLAPVGNYSPIQLYIMQKVLCKN